MSFRLVAAFVLACLVAALLNCGKESERAQSVRAEGDAPVSASPSPDDGVRRVSIAEVRAALEKNEAALIDVRGPVEYELGHPKGAILMPLGTIKTRAGELPRDRMLVTFCACKREELSVRAVQEMKRQGINNAAALVGGLDALTAAGFPTEKSAQE